MYSILLLKTIRVVLPFVLLIPTLVLADARLNQGPKPEAVGESVMVSTQLPIVTETALEVMRNGGNAVDAMITATFLQHVVDYHQVSHFGTMSGIYFEAATGRYHVISGVGVRPQAGRCGTGDPSAVSIGGVVRAMDALAERWGTLAWADYLAPAIAAAEQGVEVSSFMYGINYNALQTGQDDSLIGNAAAREFYMPDGFLVPVGERWKMPALADHLRALAEHGADYMYTGDWAQRFVAAARKGGHCVAAEDLAEYQVQWQDPVRFQYGEHTLVGSAPPDTGGAFVGLSLNMLSHFDLASRPHYSESAETLEIMARVFGRASDETRLTINDPLAMQVPVDIWTSPAYGAMAAELVTATLRQPGVSLAAPEDSETVDADTMGSDHNVIVDSQGNWFSLLHTGHGGAPGVFLDGVKATGSTARAFTSGPGRRLVLPITAIMVERDGVPWLAMGSPGMPPQPVTQVLTNILDWGMNPVEAAAAPRFWAWRGNEARIDIESRIDDEVRQGIREAGLKLVDLGPYFWSTGSMQIVWRDAETGRLHGATDPRRLGWAEGY
jgi:gamma-glutamyltranspeptidase / glutathione hydrolase